MSERKFNRDLDDTEPVKFKPIYLIVGICIVAIVILACVIYIYLNNKETNSNKQDNVVNDPVTEPTEYVIPETACQKDLTISTYNNSVYTTCTEENVVLNFTDVNMIVDTKKVGTNFTINGIYYNKQKTKTDDYINMGTFKDVKFSVNGEDVIMLLTDANTEKKTAIYIFRKDSLVYSNGVNANVVYSLGTSIGYTKYTAEGLAPLDCKIANKQTKLYEVGTINYDGSAYTEVFTKNTLVGDVCK